MRWAFAAEARMLENTMRFANVQSCRAVCSEYFLWGSFKREQVFCKKRARRLGESTISPRSRGVAADVLRVPFLPRETQHKQDDVDFSMFFATDGGGGRKRSASQYVNNGTKWTHVLRSMVFADRAGERISPG